MIAYHNPKGKAVTRRKIEAIITVPNMVEPIGKSIRAALKNPVDLQLEMYSSNNPELLDAMDLKMMSKLDRLRKHNELRVTTTIQKMEMDKGFEKLEAAKRKRDKEKQEKALQERIEKEKQNQKNQI